MSVSKTPFFIDVIYPDNYEFALVKRLNGSYETRDRNAKIHILISNYTVGEGEFVIVRTKDTLVQEKWKEVL